MGNAAVAIWFESGVWFWIAAALLWRHVCGQTLGVPNDLLIGAKGSDEDAALFERLARRNAARAAERWRHGGTLASALGGFSLAFLASVAALHGAPVAAGAFALLAPALLLAAWAGREAQRISAEALGAEALRRRFDRLRLAGFAAAGSSFLLALVFRVADRLGAL